MPSDRGLSPSCSGFSHQRVYDDLCDLHDKQLIASEQFRDFECRLKELLEPTRSASDDNSEVAISLMADVRALYQHEIDLIVAEVRDDEQSQLDGFLGQFSALLKPALPRTAALLSAMRKQPLQIKHLSGDESTCEHIVLCINGFTTQGSDPTANWRAWFGENVVVYAVLWEAGNVDAWFKFLMNVEAKTPSESRVKTSVKEYAESLWHKAQGQAAQVGVLLAQVLASEPTFCRGRKAALFGHSLGGAVIYSVFQEIARLRNAAQQDQDYEQPEPLITNAVCFASAFIPSTEGLANIAKELPTSGKFLNVFSTGDSVLSKVFWAVNLHAGDPIAAGSAFVEFPTSCRPRCTNVEVMDFVLPSFQNQFGHGYGPHMEDIFRKVRLHLASIYSNQQVGQ